jgi:hypothetical protein
LARVTRPALGIRCPGVWTRGQLGDGLGVTSIKDGVLISRTEDLRGVFQTEVRP